MNGDALVNPIVEYTREVLGVHYHQIVGGLTIRQHFTCEMMKVMLVEHQHDSLDENALRAMAAADALLRKLP